MRHCKVHVVVRLGQTVATASTHGKVLYHAVIRQAVCHSVYSRTSAWFVKTCRVTKYQDIPQSAHVAK